MRVLCSHSEVIWSFSKLWLDRSLRQGCSYPEGTFKALYQFMWNSATFPEENYVLLRFGESLLEVLVKEEYN